MYSATLKHGDTYRFAGINFYKGKSVIIDEAKKSHLEVHAVQNVLLPGGDLHSVQMFVFTSVGAASAAPVTPAPAPSASDDTDADDVAPAAAVVSSRPKAR